MSQDTNPAESKPNRLPSAYQIGDTVVIKQSSDVPFPPVQAKVIGVNFTESKVYYNVESDTGRELVIDSCDVDVEATGKLA